MPGYENETIKALAYIIMVVAAPLGIAASVIWGAITNSGARRIVGITLVFLAAIFIVTVLDKIFDLGILFAKFGNDPDIAILAIPPIIATAWVYLIINYPLQNKSIDRLGLYGLALSLFAILFTLFALL